MSLQHVQINVLAYGPVWYFSSFFLHSTWFFNASFRFRKINFPIEIIVLHLINACNSNLEFLIFNNRNCKVLAFFQLQLYFLYYFYTELISFDFSLDKNIKAQISLCKWIYIVRSMKFWAVIYGVNLVYGSVWSLSGQIISQWKTIVSSRTNRIVMHKDVPDTSLRRCWNLRSG